MLDDDDFDGDDKIVTDEDRRAAEEWTRASGIIDIRLENGILQFDRPGRDAVARAWTGLLRDRHGGTTWDVPRRTA